MIEYDYVMEKNDGYETRTFKPLFNTSIPNVAIFRGHNSSGKSTFMDLVALSMYGTDSPEVISKLKEKLEYLKGASSNFDFWIKADNKSVCLRVHSQKSGFIEGNGNWDCVVEESIAGAEFVELTKEKFRKKYRVIYDMPDRPMERVQELVREAERIIGTTKESVYSFRNSVIEELKEAQNSRDENIIFYTRSELENKKTLLSDAEDDLNQLKKLMKKVMQFYYASEFNELYAEEEKLQKMIANHLKEKAKKKKEDNKQNKDYERNLRSINNLLRLLVDEYRTSCNKLDNLEKINSSDIQNYRQFGNMTPETILRDGCSQLYEFRKVSKDLISTIENAYGDNKNLILVEKKKLLGELVTALWPYVEDDIEVLDSPVGAIYEKLDGELKAIQDQLSEYDRIQDIIAHMKKAYDAAKNADDKYENLGDRPTVDDVDEGAGFGSNLNARRNAILQRIKDSKEDAALYGVTVETYSELYENASDDIFMKNYIGMTAEELKAQAEDYSRGINSNNQKIETLKGRIAKLQNELLDYESKEPHPLSDYQKELEKLRRCLESTTLDLDSKAKMLNMLSCGQTVPENETNRFFLGLVWEYLGKRLGVIQHIGQSYEIEKIDMNLRTIFTKSGSKIQFKEMGTGESQLAYLTGLLNSDDDRITIALFDEVDHMDPIIISRIQHQLKSLYDDGKLLIGIMAAPAVGTEVESCE